MKDVRSFASLSGDTNPLHTDHAYAASSRFGKPVVHGALTASLLSTLLGTELPGPGSILVGQLLKFGQPVYVGETVTASVEVVEIQEATSLVRLTTRVVTSRGLCVDGEAVVKVPRQPASG